MDVTRPGTSAKTTLFGALLRSYRIDAGLTQAALAERAGLSVRAVQHLEAGRGQPYQETARRLAGALPLDASAREALLAASEPSPRRRAHRDTGVDLVLLFDAREGEVAYLKRLVDVLQNDHGIRAAQVIWDADHDGHVQDLREARACAVFIGARGLGDWSSGALATALGRALRGRESSLIAVLLPGAPEPFDATTLPPPLNARPWLDLRSGVEVAIAAQHLARMLRRSQDALGAPVALGTAACPYRGLEAFDEEHAELFFGREAAVQRLLEQLKSSRFVAVIAPSGSGKSSLVRAGLLPALRQSTMTGVPADWLVCKFTPGQAPLNALAAELLQLPERDSFQRTLARMARDSRALHQSVSLALARRAPSSRLVCVVDQFEEIFTQCSDEQQRSQFVANLLYAAGVPDGRSVVILTMRADFYAHCAAYPDLAAQLAAHQYLLGPLDRTGTRQVISAPAERLGLSFEPGLVDTIADEVAGEPGALPLLEHALLEVWARRQGHVLTLEGYRASGGVQGALAQRADSIFLSLAPQEQEVAREVLLRLTEPGETTEDTRRRATMDELVASASERELTERVTLALADGRLLTTSGGGERGEVWVEVAHEALIRGWPRLRQWVDEDRAALRVRRRLTQAAREWERLARDDGALYRAGVLAEALELRDRKRAGLNELEHAFLNASVALQNRELNARNRGRRLALLALSGGLVLALVLGGFAVLQWQRAESERGVALGRELAFEADAARKGAGVLLPRSVLLAAESLSRFPPRDSEPTLRQGLALLARPLLSVPQSGHASAAYSPDGQYLATADASGIAAVWAVSDGHQVSSTAPGAALRALAWSPDARFLATAGDDGAIHVWDPSSGRGLERFDQPAAADALAFSPDGSKLAAAGLDGVTRVWDLATHDALQLSTGANVVDRFSPDGGNEFAESFAQALAFSPDGRQLATARASDNAAHVWDANTGAELLRLEHDGVVLAVAFSPDGQYIATGSADGSTRIWNRDGIQVGRSTTDRSSPTFTVAFSPDSHYLATGGFSFAAEVVDVPGANDVVQLPLDDSAQSVTWSPDGTAVAAASNDGTARVWTLDGGHEIARMPMGFNNVVYQVEFSPDGTQVATSSDDGVVRTWQVTKSWQDIGLNHADSVIAVAFSPDGRYLASSAGTVAQVWDAHTGARLQTLAHPALAWALHFSPDSRYLATSSFDGYARIWDVATGQEVKRFLHGDHERVYGVRFSPDGRLLATAGLKGGVKVWNIATGGLTMEVMHDSAAGYPRFTPDGENLITGSVDHTARVWDLATGRELERMTADSPLYELDISPDGRYLAGGDDHAARIWDIATGQQLRLLPHPTGVNGVAFSADGKYLATAAKDGVARVWLVSTGEQVAGMAHDRSLNGLAFSPDGSYLATASSDHTVRLWTPLLTDPIAEACSHVIANLTPAEWAQYLPGEAYHATCPGLP